MDSKIFLCIFLLLVVLGQKCRGVSHGGESDLKYPVSSHQYSYFLEYGAIAYIFSPFVVWTMGIIFVPALYLYLFLFKFPRRASVKGLGLENPVENSRAIIDLVSSQKNIEMDINIENNDNDSTSSRRKNSKNLSFHSSNRKKQNNKSLKKVDKDKNAGGIIGFGRTLMNMFYGGGGGPCFQRVGCQMFKFGQGTGLFNWFDNNWGNNYLFRLFRTSSFARKLSDHFDPKTLSCTQLSCQPFGSIFPSFFEIFWRND